jgi:hypothetical protein
MENLKQDVNAEVSKFEDSPNRATQKKTLLELFGLGGVVLMNQHPTFKGGEDLYTSCLKLQRGDFMFNNLQA